MAKIGIVGLGLIGGSLEKRLKDNHEILAVSKSQNREYMIKDLVDCDLVFISCPQSQIRFVLKEIASLQNRDEGNFAKTIITDVASTKERITYMAEDLGIKNFIPGHPMAGTENQGYEASFPELFEDASWILCCQMHEAGILKDLIEKELGAKTQFMDSYIHDRAVAVTSHLPLVLSASLAKLGNEFAPARKTIGPGFKGMVRLAKGNVDMGQEIISFNRANIKEMWNEFKAEVDSLLEANSEDIEKDLQRTKEQLLV